LYKIAKKKWKRRRNFFGAKEERETVTHGSERQKK
jgi:hypothetical protein